MACARELRRAGHFVDMFEKGSGIGGRLGSLRMGTQSFDHGAQYITARTTLFRAFIDELMSLGYLQRWQPRIAMAQEDFNGSMLPWYVGAPTMAAIVRPLAESVRVFLGRAAHTIAREPGGWWVWFDDETREGPYSSIAIAVPAQQAALLLGPLDEMAHVLSAVRIAPCWSVSIRLSEPVLPKFDVYSDMSQTVRWVCRNSAKPGRRSREEHVVVHASQAWSRETEDLQPSVVAEELWAEVCHLLNIPPQQPAQMVAHLWKYGLTDRPLGEGCVFSTKDRVGVAGDWCTGRLAEHGFASGHALARAINGALS